MSLRVPPTAGGRRSWGVPPERLVVVSLGLIEQLAAGSPWAGAAVVVAYLVYRLVLARMVLRSKLVKPELGTKSMTIKVSGVRIEIEAEPAPASPGQRPIRPRPRRWLSTKRRRQPPTGATNSQPGAGHDLGRPAS